MRRYAIEYLMVALVLMGWDAFMSVGGGIRFEFLKSLFISLTWPISLPIAIVIATRITRHYPEGRRL